MKPFVINRSSWHYKFNTYLLDGRGWRIEKWERDHSNFCSYWRATTLRLGFAVLGAAFFLGILFVLGQGVYHHPIETLSIVFGVGFLLAALFGTIALLEWWERRKENQEPSDKPESLLMQKYRAHKEKICPMVEFKE